MSGYEVQTGGLMRCCLVSLDEHMRSLEAADTPPKEGDVVKCKFCSGEGMILKEWIWRWNHE
jgi:hypothetical protein